MKPYNWVTNIWEVGHPFSLQSEPIWTVTDGAFALEPPAWCLQKLGDLAAKAPLSTDFWYFGVKPQQARTCLTWVLWGVMLLCLDKPSGGRRVRWSGPPLFIFCLKATCLPCIDEGLLMSVACNIQHNSMWSSGVQKPLDPAEWGALCQKKTNNNSAADSHPFM